MILGNGIKAIKKQRPLRIGTNMRILVIRRGAIGDTVVTLPALEILRRSYPDSYIEVIGNPNHWEIAKGRYYVDYVLRDDASPISGLYLKDGKIGRDVSNYFSSFDLIIAYISDPEGTVSDNLRKTGVRRILVYLPFPKGDDLHAADYTALVLREIGLHVTPPLYPKIHLSGEDLDFATAFLSSHAEYKPLVAIHPRTFGIKAWPIERFINIGKWIEDTELGKTIWITGEAEEESIDLIKSHFPSSQILHLHPLPRVAAVLSLSQLYLGCDTGISHLAAAVGTPVLSLFGPTNPNVWGPRGKRVWIIKADHMSKIKEDKVKETILAFSRSRDVSEHRVLSYLKL